MRRATYIARCLLVVLVVGASTRLEAQARKGNRSPVPPYQAPGTGAVPRAIGSKLGDIISVKDFGAVGDWNGTTGTDDTTAIRNAIAAATGGTLRITRGTYKVAGHFNLPSNITIVCDGATLAEQTAGQVPFYGASISNVSITGCTITGPLSANLPTVGVAGNNCGAICFETSGSNIRIEKNIISGFFNGITGTNLTGFWARDNEISHWRLYGVLASQSVDFHIDGNRMHDNDMAAGTAWSSATTYSIGQTATANALLYMSIQSGNLNHPPPTPATQDAWWLQVATYGAMATGNHLATDQQRSSISFNKIFNNPVWDGIMSHDTDGIMIIGNDIRGVRTGIDLSTSNAGRIIEKIVIASNYIEDTATDGWGGAAALNCGVLLFGSTSALATKNASITGNIINGFGRFNSGTTAAGGICLSNTEGTVVSGNQITGTQNFAGNIAGGIEANAQGNGLAITGNSIDVAAGLSPIRLNALTADRVTITGNILRDADGTATTVAVASSSTIQFLAAKGNAYNATPQNAMTVSGAIANQRTDWVANRAVLSTGSATIPVPVGSSCVCGDATSVAAVRCSVSGTTLTITGTGTDTIVYECF